MRTLAIFLFSFIIIAAHAQKVELRIPIGHTSYIQSISISSDEKLVATAASDRTVKVWDMTDGRQLRTLTLKTSARSQVLFLKDNRHLTVLVDRGWEYWDAVDGKMIYRNMYCGENETDNKGCVISTDGTKIALVTPDGIEVREAATGNLIQSFSGPLLKDPKYAAIQLNNAWFAIASDGKMQVVNWQTKTFLKINLLDSVANNISLSPVSNELYVSGQNKLWKVDLDGRKSSLIDNVPTRSSDAFSNRFSYNGKYFLQNNQTLYNTATGEQLHYFSTDSYDNQTAISPGYFVCFNRQTGDGVLYSAKTYEKTRDFVNETAWLQRMTYNRKSNELVFTTDTKEARLWDLKRFGFEKTVSLDPDKKMDRPAVYHSFFSAQGDYYVSGDFSQKNIINYQTGKRLYSSARSIVEISPDGGIAFIEDAGKGEIVNLATNTIVKSIDLRYPTYYASPDNKTVVYRNYPGLDTRIYNYRSGTEIKATVQLGERPRFSNDGSKIYFLNALYYEKKAPSLVILSLNSGEVLKSVPLPLIEGMRSNEFVLSSDEKYLTVLYTHADEFYMASDNLLITYDVATGKEISRAAHIQGGDELTYLGDYYMVAQLSRLTNMVQFYDVLSAKHIIDITHFKGINDWIAVTPDGLYDGNMESLKKFYFVKGNEIVDPGAYFEKFYTPNLFARIMAGEKFQTVDIDIQPVPTVKISYAALQRNLEVGDEMAVYQNTTGSAEITITASAPEGKVDEIRLFQNGKVLNLTTRNLIVEDVKGASVTKKYSIVLQPGNNAIRAVALNAQRTESKPDEVMVVYKNGTAPDVPDKPVKQQGSTVLANVDKNATLYLVVVGINAYKNPSMSLNYALADATSFKEELEKDATTVIANIKTWFVKDGEANKSGIIGALAEVQKNSKPQDLFIFYYAGHGVIGSDKEFYLVPNDVSDLKNVQAELTGKGIASRLLQQYAIDIQAQKQLFILDACQSAGAFETLMTNDANQQKSLAVVARSTGTHWMAASGAQQFANEFASLGHGAFTYVLLEALKGKAFNNKMITVNGLKDFLQVQVPELMKKYNGSTQLPASYGFGNDFPVEMMK